MIKACVACSRPYQVRPELANITKYCKRLSCIKLSDRANQAKLRDREAARHVD